MPKSALHKCQDRATVKGPSGKFRVENPRDRQKPEQAP